MNLIEICLFIPFLVLGIAIHLFVCRVYSKEKFMFRGLLVGGLIFICFVIFQISHNQLNIISLYLLGTSWLAYLMFFINLLNSATLKMLSFLAESGGKLNEREFDNIFNDNLSLNVRLNSMIQNGFLSEKLVPTDKARKFLKVITLFRRILSIDQLG
jgi:hypothetical protein